MLNEWSTLRFETGTVVSLDGSVSTTADAALPTRADGSKYRWVAVSGTIVKGSAVGGKVTFRFDRNPGVGGIINGAQGMVCVGATQPVVLKIDQATHYHFNLHSGDTAEIVFGFLDWQ